MTTLEIKLSLPDRVANDAKAAGLLTSEVIGQLIAQALRRKSFDELLSVAERVEAAGVQPMTPEEINAEIKAYRAERRNAAR